MKFFVLLVFGFGVNAKVLKTGLTVSTGIDEVLQTIGPIDYYSCTNQNGSDKERVSQFAKKYGVGLYDNEEAVTNKNNFVEPCSKGDYDCIREYLANNSQCTPVCGPAPDKLYLSQTTVFLAFSNMTLTYSNYTTTGLANASITNFYLNKVTEDLVIVIEVPVLTVCVPKLYFTFRRPGKESVIKSDEAFTTFRKLTFTTIIPKKGKYRLEFADILHGYSGDGSPDFYVGPKAYTSKDPIVKAEYAEFLANIPLAIRSVFLFHSQLLAAVFIQNCICDFGLDLYSV